MNFEDVILPHLSAAYNLARWLTRNDHDAEDVVQEACVRAFQFFGAFRGGDSRAWLLRIVRNASYTWLQKNRAHELAISLDDGLQEMASDAPGPEAAVLRRADTQILQKAMEELPPEFREVLVLRELEELSYKEIAEIADVPLGTVMSRLARARRRLHHSLKEIEELHRGL